MPRALSQNSAFTVKFLKILHSHPQTSSLCCMNSKGQSTVVRMFLVILDVAEAVLRSPRWVLWEGGGCIPCIQSAVNSRTQGQLLTLQWLLGPPVKNDRKCVRNIFILKAHLFSALVD